MMTSIGKWRVGQTQHGAAKSIRIFLVSEVVMMQGMHFEHMIGASIIVLIALIYSEHVVTDIIEVLKAAIRWFQQQTRRARGYWDQFSLTL